MVMRRRRRGNRRLGSIQPPPAFEFKRSNATLNNTNRAPELYSIAVFNTNRCPLSACPTTLTSLIERAGQTFSFLFILHATSSCVQVKEVHGGGNKYIVIACNRQKRASSRDVRHRLVVLLVFNLDIAFAVHRAGRCGAVRLWSHLALLKTADRVTLTASTVLLFQTKELVHFFQAVCVEGGKEGGSINTRVLAKGD